MLGFYNVSVILTYIGLISAVTGIGLAGNGRLEQAMACLLICGVCDIFDGKIARAVERSQDAKTFGIQIDSLCDLVCFGVLPAVIAMRAGVDGLLGTAVLALYVLAAVIRLGYFNVMEQKRQQQTSENRKYYQGLPVTTASWLIPLYYTLAHFFWPGFLARGLALWMLGIAVCFVTDFRLKKPQETKLVAAGGALLAAAAAAILVWL